MAEVAVAAAFGSLQIIIPLLSQLDLQKDEHEGINSMKSWLSLLKAFIEDNYGREGNNTRRVLLDEAAKIVFDIENVLDEFLLHDPPYTFHHSIITREMHRRAHHLRHGFPLHGVSKKIASIKKEIDHITSQKAFGDRDPNSEASSSSSTVVRVSPLLLDDEMVGYEMPRNEFMTRLEEGEKRLVRLAVDGPGGSGKTTLVKNVFWKRRIQAQFHCHAWVCVSQNPDIKKTCKNLLKQLCSSRKEPYPPDDGSTVQTRLRKYLVGKRYLVVLDDIWKRQDWMHLKDALPDSLLGSRIIFTTSDSNVSSSICASSHDHRCSLSNLQTLDALKLFYRKAFPGMNGECPSEMKDISMKIVARCEGLPLAIVAVAGALQHKPPNEWEIFHDNLGSEIFQADFHLSAVDTALQRSYMDLSSSLKCCLLYMSIFPEDYTVERGRLIRLWVAEGLATATATRDKTAEEVAEGYLNQLIQRNLVHVSNSDSHGRPTNCRLQNHGLRFILKRCKETNFASIFPDENTSDSDRDQIKTIRSEGQMFRRLSVQNQFKHLEESGDFASVRSMFLLRLPKISTSDFEKNLSKLKLVKVVDVQGAPLTEFPEEITRFTLMRYLSFRETKIKSIPSSIKKLSYLETLDLKQTDVTELPQEISHLHNLCHLLVYNKNESNNHVAFNSVQGVKLHKAGISKLTNLQNLSLVKVDPKGKILQDLKGLIQLRKLGLTGLRREHSKDLCAAVKLMEKLTTLNLCSATMQEYIELEGLKNPPKTLERLYLNGRLKTFPSWISKLDNLLRIRLKWSKLENFPLEDLESLPQLTELHLLDCYTGLELIFGASGFKKLKILVMEDFTNLHTIVIHNGAMPELKQISLRSCRRMVMLLGGENLVEVEELTLHHMAQEFIARFRTNGEYGDWVRRIPLVHSFANNTRENLSDSVRFRSINL